MTRGKVKLEFMASEYARKASFKKRTKGMFKKLNELSVLCGVQVCAIVYGPYDDLGPEIWPKSPSTVENVVEKYRKMHEDDQYIKEFNQESYLKQRITKSIEKLTKSNRDIREKEVGQTMFQCLAGRTMSDMSFFDLNDIAWTIEKKMKDLCRLIGSNDGDQVQAAMNGEAALVVPPYVVPPPVVPVSEEDGMLINGEAGLVNDQVQDYEMNLEQEIQNQPWFKNMKDQENFEFSMDELDLEDIGNQDPFFASLLRP